MKIIFFGTPEYVMPVLKRLHREHEIVAVVTQPPSEVGREKKVKRTEVDHWAYKRKIPIFFDFGKPLPAADLGVLAAYGKIIPKDVILNTKYGIFNIHPSLLPKYKGASPVQAAITNGEQTTGVTIIKMDEKLDHGPILSSFREDINPDDTTGSLRERLFQRSAQFVVDLIPNYLSGKIKPKKQDHAKATLTKILKREDGFIDAERFTSEARKVECLIRAMDPWPGAWTLHRLSASEGQAKRLKILKAHLKNHKLILDKVQLEGKTPVSFEEFKRGYPDFEFS